MSVAVSQRGLGKILSGGSGTNTLITSNIDGTAELASARELQRHPVQGNVIHVDFVRVRADQTIQAEIPVHLVGEAEGAVRGGRGVAAAGERAGVGEADGGDDWADFLAWPA